MKIALILKKFIIKVFVFLRFIFSKKNSLETFSKIFNNKRRSKIY